MKKTLFLSALILLAVFCAQTHAQDLTQLRLGVLKFGTVNWELDVIKQQGLDKKYGIDLQITHFGGKNATHVALQGGAVDVIVSDWIWVSRLRSQGRTYTFAPYSLAVGALMLPADNPAKTLADLAGQTLGVAGGPLDKTWLLLRAYHLKQYQTDLADRVKPRFAAPPLLNKLVQRGELDGVINFWHYAARLKAKSYRPLIEVADVLKALGVEHKVPLVGWVFGQQWAQQHTQAISGLLQASAEAKQLLAQSTTQWQRLRPLMQAQDEQTFQALIKGFRAGIPDCFSPRHVAAAEQTFHILAQAGGTALTGKSSTLSPGTFWPSAITDTCQP